MKFLTHCDLNKNELRNAVLQPLATAPESPRLGQVYFDTTDNCLKQYDGAEWQRVGVVYEKETDTNGVITGLAEDGTVTVTAIDDMTLEDGTTLGDKIVEIKEYVAVQSDWSQTDETKADFIKNKPKINTTLSSSIADGVLYLKQQIGACVAAIENGILILS